MTEMSPDSIDQYVESLRAFAEMVRRRCAKSRQFTDAAELSGSIRDETLRIFLADTEWKSLVLAARRGHLLWSDDVTLATFLCERLASTRWAWTQAFLMAAK